MNSDKILGKFRDTDALLEGHFVLSSGLHSATYLQCALALQYPMDAAEFGRAITQMYAGEQFDTVASPAIGGLVIGYEVAKALNVRFIWTERKEGVMTLRRGFGIKPGERILVAEDVITTGGSVVECIDVLKAEGGDVAAAASIVDRSGGTADVGVPRKSLLEMNVESFDPSECPMCKEGSPAVKPGSRGN